MLLECNLVSISTQMGDAVYLPCQTDLVQIRSLSYSAVISNDINYFLTIFHNISITKTPHG